MTRETILIEEKKFIQRRIVNPSLENVDEKNPGNYYNNQKI